MSKEFKFWLLTDPHFFKNSLGAYGEGYNNFMENEQKCFAETEVMNRAVNEFLKSNNDADTILIAGDLSFNGEKESHLEYKKLLGDLKASGKKIYVVTAGHDIEPNPFCFPGTAEREHIEGIKFDDLYDLYREFGYDNAIAFNREHLSYVAQLSDGIRLLVLCNDTAEGKKRPYDEEFRAWIKEQLDKAKADGQLIFAMEHYPVLAGQPFLQIIGDARQPEAQTLIDLLADNGCHLIFTGHMHNQSINVVETEKGNKFYDICTGSLIGCPAFMRLCTITDNSTIDIKSVPVPDFEWETGGKTCEEYLQAQFDSMILNILTGMRDNPQKVMHKLGIKPSPALEKIFGALGKILCSYTLGKAARLFMVKAEEGAKDMMLLDFIASVVRYAFCGNQPYTEDSPAGKTFLKVLRRLKPILSLAGKKLHGSQGEEIDLYEMLKHTIGNYGIDDYNAVLEIK